MSVLLIAWEGYKVLLQIMFKLLLHLLPLKFSPNYKYQKLMELMILVGINYLMEAIVRFYLIYIKVEKEI